MNLYALPLNMCSPAAVTRPLRLTVHHRQKLSVALDGFVSGGRRFKSGASRHVGQKLQTTIETTPEKCKTIDDLHGPSLATTVYWLFVKGYADKSHAMQVEHKKLYGPIWRSRFGPFDVVNVASPELISQVIRQEGRYPVRTELPHWKEYRDMRGQAYGLHVDTGPQWHRIRSVLNPKMLKLAEVSAYAPVIHQVVGDLLQRIERLRLRSQDHTTVPDLTAELYKFGFEGISSILFETRLGCLQEEIPKDTLKFIAAANDMLTLSETVLFLPLWTRNVLPFWKRFVQAWDDLVAVAQRLIDHKLAQMDAQVLAGKQVEGMYLTYLLSCDKLTLGEVYISITELLLGGVDTTSNTLSWALYQLARDAASQDRLYREIMSVCPGRQQPRSEDLSRMPYLKAVIKETLRMYPVVPGNGRLTVDNEVVVDNYWFPKKTQFHLCHYAASHDEGEFVDAECFRPDRWLRGDPESYQHHPYSSIPFGVGVRACVGKRVAELEMYFALSRLMQHYEIQPEDGAPTTEPKTRTLLIPSKPINLRFLPRA
ncbi:sterol 26-hydroxylase, mitochondrial-like [Oncorhynchus clarkii lewisi]|uniref:sterol 26-hydroxylase, mitochondrial-like n=1 Tax=Oncorhynchus clarkii lewisi TaxID=490388 RepID=UPI0039B89D87